MGKAKKIIIGVVVTALVGTGIGGGLMYVRKGSQKEVLVASVSDLAGERYDSDTTLSGTVYANATQRISIEKDMIIQEIYVSKGDEVKPGDKLISFDMTLVEMELNIAKLKLQKQQQDLAAAKKRLTSLQNGGPILDSDSSSADNLIDSGKDSTEDDSSDSMGDDEPQVGYRREWVPPAEDVLPCKALLLSCGGRSYIYSDDHRVQHEGAVPVSAGPEV